MQDFLHLGQVVPETGRMQIVVGRTLYAETGANNREWREKNLDQEDCIGRKFFETKRTWKLVRKNWTRSSIIGTNEACHDISLKVD